MMAASAEPVFINPLAEPEKRGAMSIGIAHIGPMVNSEKKKARLRQIAAQVRLCKNKIGIMDASDNRKPNTTAQTMLMIPSNTNDPRQLISVISHATTGGVRAFPNLALECVIPCAKPRRDAGVQSHMARVAVGNVAPSPNPSITRAKSM